LRISDERDEEGKTRHERGSPTNVARAEFRDKTAVNIDPTSQRVQAFITLPDSIDG
jgi:hypothetical protein